MRIRERYELAAELAGRYRAAGRKQRSQILDSFCLATGYNRKYAMAMLAGRARVKGPVRRPRARRYEGQPLRMALGLVWEASGYICAERLHPFLLELAELLVKHRQLQLDASTRQLLESISVSTLRRGLRTMRPTAIWNPRLLRPPSHLKGMVPVVLNNLKVFDEPGHIEIDLVSHSGRYATGEWIYTLTGTDLCSGWTEVEPVMSKYQRPVLDAIGRLRRQRPFELLSLHIDNGHEFLNEHLIEYCRKHGIRLGRGRPHHTNANAHVEQKNGYLVRGLLADQRLDCAEQMEWLVGLYTMVRPFINCFQPVMRRVGRINRGTSSRRLHDRARTPLQRLLDSGKAKPANVADLVQLYSSVSPLTLRRNIEAHLARMPRALQFEPGRPRKEVVARAS